MTINTTLKPVENPVENSRKFSPKTRKIGLVCFIFAMMATLSFLLTRGMSLIGAISADGFNPGNIISDAVMADYNSMTLQEIQAFLTEKNPCNNKNYNLYLEQSSLYSSVTWHWENDHFVCLSEEKFGDGTVIGEGQTAAEIIYQAAQEYKINPKVLIVLLEKEQGLITDTYPHSGQYRAATGYGCPDTAACDSKYYGFKNQVNNAAALFRYTLDNGYSVFPEQKSGVYVGYHPNSSCGRSEVLIENRATSALYRYTPYQPNAAALNAGFGTGNSCSSYGNRNFYLYFINWFGEGSTQVPSALPEETPPLGETTSKPTTPAPEAQTPTDSPIPDGTYSFSPKYSTDFILAIKDNNVELGASTTEYVRAWSLKRGEDGFYTLTDTLTRKVLATEQSTLSDGTNISLQTPTGSCTEKWKITLVDEKYLAFESSCATSMMMDVSNAGTFVGANIQAYTSNGTSAQKWSFEQVAVKTSEGIYTFLSNLDANFALDASGTTFGANVHLWTKHYKYNQKWQILYDETKAAYRIYNLSSGQVLTVDKAESRANVYAGKPTGSCGDYWQIIDEGNGLYSFVSSCNENFAIDVSNYANNAVNIQLWPVNHTPAQKWSLSTETALGIWDYILNSNLPSNRALDVYGGFVASGTNVQIWDTNYTAAQRWKLVYVASAGHHTLTNPASGKVLYVKNQATTSGDNIIISDADDSCAMYWDVVDMNGGYSIVSACNPRMAVDVTNANSGSGTNVQIWEINGTPAQKWHFNF